MGKQLSIYLDEQEAERLTEIAQRECRRPIDQVRFILRRELGIAQDQTQTQPVQAKQEPMPA
jgi:hypothetical protein